MAAPALFGAGLHDLKAAVHHLKDVGRHGAVLRGQVHRDHVGGAQLAREDRGDFHAHGAIHQHAVLIPNRLEEARIGATRANRQEDIAGIAEGDRGSAGKVGGDHAERDPHLLEAVTLQQAFEEALHALADHEPHAAKAPARHIAETHGASGLGDFGGRGAAGIGRGDDRTRTDAGDAMNRESRSAPGRPERRRARLRGRSLRRAPGRSSAAVCGLARRGEGRFGEMRRAEKKLRTARAALIYPSQTIPDSSRANPLLRGRGSERQRRMVY